MSPLPAIDDIWPVMIVWKIRGNMILCVLSCIVCRNCAPDPFPLYCHKRLLDKVFRQVYNLRAFLYPNKQTNTHNGENKKSCCAAINSQ